MMEILLGFFAGLAVGLGLMSFHLRKAVSEWKGIVAQWEDNYLRLLNAVQHGDITPPSARKLLAKHLQGYPRTLH